MDCDYESQKPEPPKQPKPINYWARVPLTIAVLGLVLFSAAVVNKDARLFANISIISIFVGLVFIALIWGDVISAFCEDDDDDEEEDEEETDEEEDLECEKCGDYLESYESLPLCSECRTEVEYYSKKLKEKENEQKPD